MKTPTEVMARWFREDCIGFYNPESIATDVQNVLDAAGYVNVSKELLRRVGDMLCQDRCRDDEHHPACYEIHTALAAAQKETGK